MNPQERRQLIDSLIEGDISEADFLRLEAEFSVDPLARKDYYERLALSSLLEAEAKAHPQTANKIVPMPEPKARNLRTWLALAAAFTALMIAAGLLWPRRQGGELRRATEEQKAVGFAAIAGQASAAWNGPAALADGALVPTGPLSLSSGLVQIELFSGVTTVIEGAADFEIVSPMEMVVTRGKVRARVPEPAQGFRIRTANGEVVDLGTEFALDVSPARSEIHVLEGQVEWHPRSQTKQVVDQGEALRWDANGHSDRLVASAASFVDVAGLALRRDSARNSRRAEWDRFNKQFRRDSRLVAYYQMSGQENWNRQVANLAAAGASLVREGAVVAAARAADRWGVAAGALDFSPAGSRVRLHVPGAYGSLTMICWAKINSLDRLFNSLFLTDGHKLGAPHWQITQDGRLFFSVKKFERHDPAQGRRDKYEFYSPPFWNASLSGQWFMIAVTYDIESRSVTHYVNGQPIGSEPVPEEYLVQTVQMGNASIGNWSEPAYRQDPEFAVRNLNGSMDEFALFAAALSEQEIKDIYEHGKP